MSAANAVVYDGFNFADNGIVLSKIDHMTLAKRDNQVEKRANRDGAVLVQSQLGTKPINLEGYFSGATPADAQAMYDTLAQILNRQDRVLLIPHAGGVRRYIATPENIIIQEPDGLNKLTFSFEFVVPQGSSEDSVSMTLLDTVVTSASTSIPVNVAGSVTARPLITVTFTSVTGGTGKTVSIRNAKDFIGLTFARNFVTGDVITIDSDNFQIYINGVLTAPSGRMPTLPAGPGSLYYSDTFTNRSVRITATYIQRNL